MMSFSWIVLLFLRFSPSRSLKHKFSIIITFPIRLSWPAVCILLETSLLKKFTRKKLLFLTFWLISSWFLLLNRQFPPFTLIFHCFPVRFAICLFIFAHNSSISSPSPDKMASEASPSNCTYCYTLECSLRIGPASTSTKMGTITAKQAIVTVGRNNHRYFYSLS